jgi:hypothetical protein
MKLEPVDIVMSVEFVPGQGFAAIPLVPDMTGAEDVVDDVVVVVVDVVEVESGAVVGGSVLAVVVVVVVASRELYV